jgi:hypothetical protein
MNSKEQIRLILSASQDAEKQIVSKIANWKHEAERLQADLERQQMRGSSTRATGAAAAVLIEVVKEERQAFRKSLTEPGPHGDADLVEKACEDVLGVLKAIEALADSTREQTLR